MGWGRNDNPISKRFYAIEETGCISPVRKFTYDKRDPDKASLLPEVALKMVAYETKLKTPHGVKFYNAIRHHILG